MCVVVVVGPCRVAGQAADPTAADHHTGNQRQPDEHQRQDRHHHGRAAGRIEPLEQRFGRLLRSRASATASTAQQELIADYHRSSARGCCGWRFEISASVLPFLFREFGRQHDLNFREQVAGSPFLGRTPWPLMRSRLPLEVFGGIVSAIVP